MLADGAVTSSKLADESVTQSKIGEKSIDSTKLRKDCVTQDKIKNLAVSTDKIQDGAISTDKIQDNAVTNAKLGANSVTTDKLSEIVRNKIDAAIDYTIELTYSELKALRDAGSLIPGQSYRITDFVTTTAQAQTQSAAHPFDIIVIADDERTLNEDARAIRHEGDEYFAKAKLNAWRLSYCLDNDTKRFAWADETDGKGVIYRMIDEFNNDLPYDFKNIQFKLYEAWGHGWDEWVTEYLEMDPTDVLPYRLTLNSPTSHNGYTWERGTNFIWAYTFSTYESGVTSDKTMGVDMQIDPDTPDTYRDDVPHDNVVGVNWECLVSDDNRVYRRANLNFQIWIPFFISFKDDCFRVFGTNTGINCHDNVFGRKCYQFTLGNDCFYCFCGNSCSSWTCGNDCYSWTCGNDCYSWTCGNSCSSWTCGNDCSSWTCGSWTGSTNIPQDYVQYFHIASGTSNFRVKSSGSPTYYLPLKNFKIKSGTSTPESGMEIVIDTADFPLNSDYEWTIAKNSKGEIKQYCEADLIN